MASNETAESLDGFDSGVITDVPIDSRKPVKPNPPQKRIENEAEKNALDLRKLTQNSAVFPLKQKLRRREASSSDGSRPKESTETEKPKIEKFIGEQADQALLRTMLQQLKSADYSKADFSAAERTLKLLEKAYPESAALAESRFQMGLFHYRGRLKAKDEVAKVAALRAADFYLSEAQQMTVQSPHIQAGSALMRGVIARLLLNSGGETRNADIARKNFEFVLKQYPNTLEAQRAKRELASMDRRTW